MVNVGDIVKIVEPRNCPYNDTHRIHRGQMFQIKKMEFIKENYTRYEAVRVGTTEHSCSIDDVEFTRINNIYNCKHSCPSCNKKCGLWEAE